MIDYFARCSYLLQQGLFVADVCYYNGDEAPNFVGPKSVDPGWARATTMTSATPKCCCGAWPCATAESCSPTA